MIQFLVVRAAYDYLYWVYKTVRSLGIEDHSSVKLPGIFNMIQIVLSDEKGPQLVSIHSE